MGRPPHPLFQLIVVKTNRTVILEYEETSETVETFPVMPWRTEEICYVHV